MSNVSAYAENREKALRKNIYKGEETFSDRLSIILRMSN